MDNNTATCIQINDHSPFETIVLPIRRIDKLPKDKWFLEIGKNEICVQLVCRLDFMRRFHVAFFSSETVSQVKTISSAEVPK